MPRRSTLGPRSRNFGGSQVSQRWGGSTTWSSTLMIFGSSVIAAYCIQSSDDDARGPQGGDPLGADPDDVGEDLVGVLSHVGGARRRRQRAVDELHGERQHVGVEA